MTDRDALLAGNAAFYTAIAEGDFVTMSALWAKDDGISCVHPGWPALVGWNAVLSSWRAILTGSGNGQITFHDPYAILSDSDGRVLCIESVNGHLLQAANHFRLLRGAWRLTHHHASPISPRETKPVVPEPWLN
jgi:hypothetical protein